MLGLATAERCRGRSGRPNAEGLSGVRRRLCGGTECRARRSSIASPNLQLVGRNGMHKYNNQDHSMLTAMLAVKNILGAKHDLWGVNVDQEYHEEITGQERGMGDLAQVASTQPQIPRRLDRPTPP